MELNAFNICVVFDCKNLLKNTHMCLRKSTFSRTLSTTDRSPKNNRCSEKFLKRVEFFRSMKCLRLEFLNKESFTLNL
jgi:hypothetical protein